MFHIWDEQESSLPKTRCTFSLGNRLPVESAKCLRLGDLQTEFKMSTKPLLKYYCALSTGKESAETELLDWLL